MRGLALWDHHIGTWLNVAVGDDPEALAVKANLGGTEDNGQEFCIGNGSAKFGVWCSERYYVENRDNLLVVVAMERRNASSRPRPQNDTRKAKRPVTY